MEAFMVAMNCKELRLGLEIDKEIHGKVKITNSSAIVDTHLV